MKEIKFKTAKLATEKGYNKITDSAYDLVGNFGNYYDIVNESPYEDSLTPNGSKINFDSLRYPAPFKSDLQDWLRDEKGIIVTVLPYIDYTISNKTIVYRYQVFNHLHSTRPYEDYYKCLEAGLKEGLRVTK